MIFDGNEFVTLLADPSNKLLCSFFNSALYLMIVIYVYDDNIHRYVVFYLPLNIYVYQTCKSCSYYDRYAL